MKKLKKPKKISNDAAGEVFKEFSWSLAAVIHRGKSDLKIPKRARKVLPRQTNSSVEKNGVSHQC
ncbi:hypothetical protein MNBD_ALPHA11-1419 [hydrothermal vent metagenome]|uniref:Uncharacterized protein n=1 Tax=hydrothermal vent metagenome TaxID=652676 RepID=A0A3B0UDQ0_9ZZZZ